MTILDEILRRKRHEVATAMRAVPIDAVKARALVQPPARSFASRLRARRGEPARLIAEIKRKSPSAGAMSEIADPSDLARLYAENGASAISVLTDFHHFGGNLTDLRAVHDAVTVPVLRKDFLFTEYQMWEARAAGADAALIIVAALASPLGDPIHLDGAQDSAEPDYAAARDRLATLLRVARKAGLEVLVEVHDDAEAAVAADVKAPIIGINNRNLANFVTSLSTTETVIANMKLAPNHHPVIVSESGLHDADAVSRVRSAGAHAILVGEALVRSETPANKVREMSGILAK
jgi:indole-3-glycerol phosphate synthase